MTPAPRIPPEFSRPIAADSIGNQAQHRKIEADPAERAALAWRFGLVSLDCLTATLELRRHAGDTVTLTGHLIADVVQSCVVTLAAVAAHIETGIETDYSAAEALAPAVDLDPQDGDAPEPLIDGEIDMGEAVAQQLAVALDPYPRVPGAELPPGIFAGGDETGKKPPFAALAVLRKRP